MVEVDMGEGDLSRFAATRKGLVMLGRVKSTTNDVSKEDLKLNAEAQAKLEEYYAACKAIDDEPDEEESGKPPDNPE
jgi:predicted HicB family RNase H-like nuclease